MRIRPLEGRGLAGITALAGETPSSVEAVSFTTARACFGLLKRLLLPIIQAEARVDPRRWKHGAQTCPSPTSRRTT